MLSEEIFTSDTIAVGFNNIRFDDEFIRHCFGEIFTIHMSGLGKTVDPDGIYWMWCA